jgi:hypothetical protein
MLRPFRAEASRVQHHIPCRNLTLKRGSTKEDYSVTQLLNPYVASTAGNSSSANSPRPLTLALVTSTTAATITIVPAKM